MSEVEHSCAVFSTLTALDVLGPSPTETGTIAVDWLTVTTGPDTDSALDTIELRATPACCNLRWS